MISKLKMTEILLSEIMLEEKLVELWPDYGCLYDVRSPDFKNRDKRQVAIATKLSFFRFFDIFRTTVIVPSCRFAYLRPPSRTEVRNFENLRHLQL